MTTRRRVLLSLAALPFAPACAGGTLPPVGDDDDSANVGDDDDSAVVGDDDDSALGDDDDSTEPPPPPFVPPGNLDLDAFPAALQTADALPNAVLVGVRTIEPEVVLLLGRVDGDEVILALQTEPMTVTDGILDLELTDLLPDTAWRLVVADATLGRRSEVARFRTALAPGQRRPLLIAATSCLGRTGAPWQSLRFAAEQEPDVCLLLGDTVYADGSSTLTEYRGFWDEALETVGLYRMSLATSFVATWDDHEVDNNWSWSQHGDQVPYALQAFREGIPQRLGPAADRVYRSLKWGDAVELIVLDCRADRGDGRYVSEAQMAWIQDTLSTSTARIKIVLNSVPIIDFQDWIGGLSGSDRWQGHPTQRTELLTFIENAGITGVLFVSGDMHFGSVCRVSRSGRVGDGLWEVMAGPGGSIINPMALLPPSWTNQFDLVVAESNSTLLEVDPDARTVRVIFIDDAGDVIDERLLEL